MGVELAEVECLEAIMGVLRLGMGGYDWGTGEKMVASFTPVRLPLFADILLWLSHHKKRGGIQIGRFLAAGRKINLILLFFRLSNVIY